jgi:hypothetical protein
VIFVRCYDTDAVRFQFVDHVNCVPSEYFPDVLPAGRSGQSDFIGVPDGVVDFFTSDSPLLHPAQRMPTELDLVVSKQAIVVDDSSAQPVFGTWHFPHSAAREPDRQPYYSAVPVLGSQPATERLRKLP